MLGMEENNLGYHVRNSVAPLIEGVKAAEVIEYNTTINKKKFIQSWTMENELQKNKTKCIDSLKEKCQKQQMKKKHGTG